MGRGCDGERQSVKGMLVRGSRWVQVVRVAELGERSTDPDPENFSSDHVFTAEMV